MIKLRVPATSANMGAGFDTLGVAVGLYNRMMIEEIPEGLEVINKNKKKKKSKKLYPTGYKQFDLPRNGGTFRLCRL